MASVNRVILLGRLGNQPELRYTPNNNAVTELRIATNRRFKGRDDQWTEKTEWHSVVVWGKQAETCERYLSKGREVFVEGRLQTRDWVDQQSGQKRYKTEIVAERVQFLGGRGDGGGRQDGDGGGGSDDSGQRGDGDNRGGDNRGGGGGDRGPAGDDSGKSGGGQAAEGTGFNDPEGDIPF